MNRNRSQSGVILTSVLLWSLVIIGIILIVSAVRAYEIKPCNPACVSPQICNYQTGTCYTPPAK